MAKSRKKRTRRRYYRRPRRNPTTMIVRTSATKKGRRRGRHRKNPLVPTGILGRALTLGAGFLAAPMVTKLVPWQPETKWGEYVKTGVVVGIGAQVAKAFLGRRYANALMAGGFLWIAVDALKTYVTPFGGNAGVSYYYPPDDQLVASWGQSGLPPAAEMPGNYLPSMGYMPVH